MGGDGSGREEDRAPGQRLTALADAAKYGKTLKGPRRLLLEDAMQHDEAAPSVYWAKEVLRLEPQNADAHYVMAAEALGNARRTSRRSSATWRHSRRRRRRPSGSPGSRRGSPI